MKTCGKCGLEKSLDEFPLKNRVKNTRSSMCKDCHAEYSREHYQNNKQKYAAKRLTYQHRMAQFIQELKATTPCTDCGIKYPQYVMEFDHLPEFEKLASVSSMTSAGMDKVLAEIAKCEIVCANCHATRTWKRQQA